MRCRRGRRHPRRVRRVGHPAACTGSWRATRPTTTHRARGRNSSSPDHIVAT
jgi:hypothetical protein